MFSMSDAYERFMGRWSRVLAHSFVAFANVKATDDVLDVGTGTGALASALEALPAGTIVALDPSPAFIEVATKNASSRVCFEVGDAQALRFPDASFDHTLALLVMNFIPDHEKALGEMRRVTRPGGTVSACVWDYGGGMEMLRFFWDEVVASDPAAESHDERHMKLSREGELGELWRTAGLADVQERALTVEQPYTSFDDYWAPFMLGAGPGGAYVTSLAENPRRALEARLRRRLVGDRGDGMFTLKAKAWCVRGKVPN